MPKLIHPSIIAFLLVYYIFFVGLRNEGTTHGGL